MQTAQDKNRDKNSSLKSRVSFKSVQGHLKRSLLYNCQCTMNQMQECTSLDLGRYSSCIFQTVENIKQGDQVNLFFPRSTFTSNKRRIYITPTYGPGLKRIVIILFKQTMHCSPSSIFGWPLREFILFLTVIMIKLSPTPFSVH